MSHDTFFNAGYHDGHRDGELDLRTQTRDEKGPCYGSRRHENHRSLAMYDKGYEHGYKQARLGR